MKRSAGCHIGPSASGQQDRTGLLHLDMERGATARSGSAGRASSVRQKKLLEHALGVRPSRAAREINAQRTICISLDLLPKRAPASTVAVRTPTPRRGSQPRDRRGEGARHLAASSPAKANGGGDRPGRCPEANTQHRAAVEAAATTDATVLQRLSTGTSSRARGWSHVGDDVTRSRRPVWRQHVALQAATQAMRPRAGNVPRLRALPRCKQRRGDIATKVSCRAKHVS